MLPSHHTKLPHRVVLLVAATAVALGIGEVAVRWSAAAPAIKSLNVDASELCVYQRSENALLGFELKPNFICEDPDYISTYERTNAFGLRDQARKVHKPPGTSRILLLGDSVVEGYGLAESDTISNQLQAIYDDEGEKVEILNFGVSAYCTRAEVELLETKGLQFAPDVVVVVFVENDFDNFNREAFPLQEKTQPPAAAQWYFKKSHLFRLACFQLNWFQFRQLADPARWNSTAIGDNNVTDGLRRLRFLADQHRFQAVVAIWPRFGDQRVEDVHFVSGSQQLVVEAIAAQCGIPSFRLSNHFQALKTRETGITPRIAFSQGDRLHPSARGAAEAAHAIHRQIQAGIPLIGDTAVSSESLDLAVQQLSSGKPEYTRVYNRIGNRLLKHGEYEQAIEQYQLALAENPDDAATHCNLGIALARRNPDAAEEAIRHYRLAIELQPDFAEAHLNLGQSLEALDPDAAQQHFIRAVQIQPNLLAAHLALCRNLFRSGRLTAAHAGVQQALAIDDHSVDALLLLATIQTKQQDLQQARDTFMRVVELSPTHAEAHNNLAAVLVALSERQAAIEHLRQAVAADPDHPHAAENLRALLKSEQ